MWRGHSSISRSPITAVLVSAGNETAVNNIASVPTALRRKAADPLTIALLHSASYRAAALLNITSYAETRGLLTVKAQRLWWRSGL